VSAASLVRDCAMQSARALRESIHVLERGCDPGSADEALAVLLPVLHLQLSWLVDEARHANRGHVRFRRARRAAGVR
jgi:hypothetical protein